MHFYHSIKIIVVLAMMGSCASAWGDEFPDIHENSNLRRLLHPSEQQIKMEKQQKVFMYVGLTDRDIDRAMDENFDRIESFMIAGVIMTDENGQVMRNPRTGEVMTEEDGC